MKEIDIVFYDIRQAFDSLWTQHTYMDIHRNGMKNDMLNVLHEGSKSAEVVIKTPMGETEKEEILIVISNSEISLSGK